MVGIIVGIVLILCALDIVMYLRKINTNLEILVQNKVDVKKGE